MDLGAAQARKIAVTNTPGVLDDAVADPDFEELAGEQWLILLPHKWNPTTHRTVYSWHYDPRELGATAAPERDVR